MLPRLNRLRPKPTTYLFGAAIVLCIVMVLPSCVYIYLQHEHTHFILGLQYCVIIIFSLSSFFVLWESVAALFSRAPSASDAEVEAMLANGVTAIIAAYLPNESEIIADTLRHFLLELQNPHGNLQIILAYNSPQSLEVEDDLRALEEMDSRLFVLNVHGSTSKAENVNAALNFADGGIVGVFDADHLPAADVFCRAAQWISAGWDMVQGRCVIRNASLNLLTRLIAVEFNTIYAVSHQGRFNITGTAVFGGSNGYWRTSVIKTLGFDNSMLTEDIDLSVRALLAGRKLAHDSSIISTELAPVRGIHWLSQRKRWAQGWFEVTLKHGLAILKSHELSYFQRVAWLYLLPWREVYPTLGTQFFPLMACSIVTGSSLFWFSTPFTAATTTLNLACAPMIVLITYLNARRLPGNFSGFWYLPYAAGALVYTTAKTLVSLIAQVAHFTRDTAWVTTPRYSLNPIVNVSPQSPTANTDRT